MICSHNEGWSSCSVKIKAAISHADTPQSVFDAANEWADRYRRLYNANAQSSWTPSDQDRLEEGISDLYEDFIGKYLDPAALAFSMAIAKYLPRLAASLALAGSASVQFFFILLAPSPIANDFTAARPVNDEINQLVANKLDQFLPPNWRNSYDDMFRKAFQNTTGGPIVP